MNDRAVSIFEKYDIQVLRTAKGRGALLAQTADGWYILKEYTGSKARIAAQEKLLSQIREAGFVNVEQLMRNKEGELISYDQDRIPYILKTWFEGRECNLRDVRECQNVLKMLGRLHRVMEQPVLFEEYQLSPFSLEKEYAKHNRELKKVRRYLQKKGRKTEFELYLLHHYDFFYEKALAAADSLRRERERQEAQGGKEEPAGARASFCHGDFQQHNLIWGSEGFAVINFEKFLLDNPIRDLYLFLRKLLEKNSWSCSLALSMMTAYETQRTLTDEDRMQLYYRFAYPEKFWKIVNFYYNSTKVWIPGRNQEKLAGLLNQEAEKCMFLESMRKAGYCGKVL